MGHPEDFPFAIWDSDYWNCWSHAAREVVEGLLVGSSRPQKLCSLPADLSLTTHSTPARSSVGPICFVHITRKLPLLCRCCKMMVEPGWSEKRNPPSCAPIGLISTVCANAGSGEESETDSEQSRTGKTIFVRIWRCRPAGCIQGDYGLTARPTKLQTVMTFESGD